MPATPTRKLGSLTVTVSVGESAARATPAITLNRDSVGIYWELEK
jgi:hypothetical protein